MASAIALQTLADVQEQGELYASNYLHVKRHDSTVRRLQGERVVLEIGSSAMALPIPPFGLHGRRQTSGGECDLAHPKGGLRPIAAYEVGQVPQNVR